MTPTYDASAALAGVAPVSLPIAAAGRFGWLGVEVFFVISGMMIAESVAPDTRRISFLRRRALRLMPAAWICASLTAAAILLTLGLRGGLMRRWLRSVCFWPIGNQIDPSYWTLGIEVSFYFLVAVGLAARVNGAWLGRVAIGLTLWTCGFWLAWIAGLPVMPDHRIVQLILLPHGALFAAGIFLARWSQVRERPAWGVLVTLVVACLIEIYSHDLGHATVSHLPQAAWVPAAVFAAAVAIVV